MPNAQLLNAVIETSANQALKWASNSKTVLAPLQSKICIIHVQELQHVMVFSFAAQRIDVLADEANEYQSLPDELDNNSCWVSVSLFALDKLKQNNQMTKLIKSGQLDFAGDLSILQGVSSLFDKLELDVEEVLASYIGDPAAYQLNTSSKRLFAKAQHDFAILSQTLSDAALDEKPIGVRKIMVVNFCDEVNQLRADADRFQARLEQLEAKSLNSAGSHKGSIE